ncbi:MAG TPA: diguanylate cyclase [Candidatus Acidoferrales bacterium]|nr:diguanylate cyclase [Candidatus Acidoferrales bacterium]
MATEVDKTLERARKFLEKNKTNDAIDSYLSVLNFSPGNPEAVQALGDLFTQKGDAQRAAQYYGMIFDRLIEPRDEAKAIALYSRYLKSFEQPAERQARYAILLHRQKKIPEAIENYSAAAERFLVRGKHDEALKCYELITELDPENSDRQINLAQLAEDRGRTDVAARAYVRAGQLALSKRETTKAIDLLGRAHRVAPSDNNVSLLYAQAQLATSDIKGALETLKPLEGAEPSPAFQRCFGEALLRNGELDRAAEPLTAYYRAAGGDHSLLFDLADRYASAGQEKKTVEILTALREKFRDSSAQNEFASRLDNIAEKNTKSLPIVEFWSRVYSGLNREARYFEVLVHLFDAYLGQNNTKGACDVLDRMVDIDPYDYRNQQRLERLRGHASSEYIARVASRLGVTMSSASEATEGASTAAPEPAAEIGLDDLLVQAEIFLQYSLQPKALERLERISQLYPGEEERNERYRHLCELANWWPPGSTWKAPAADDAAEPEGEEAERPAPARGGVYTAETLRDLSKISEITQSIYRQSGPQAMLTHAVSEIGKHMRVARCIVSIGPMGQPSQLSSEYCTPPLKPVTVADITRIVAEMDRAVPDPLGGLPMQAAAAHALREAGLTTALAVMLMDKETQTPAGMIIAGHTSAHKWKPDETYFLQAIGDQLLMGVSHTRLRSLVQTLQVSDSKTGLIARSSYTDRLIAEVQRAKPHSWPVSLIILQIDKGQEITRQQGDATVDRYLEDVARTVMKLSRPTDLAVKYTAWSMALILPDTPLAGALAIAERMKAAATRNPNGSEKMTVSAGVVESFPRGDYDTEDVVTELINRAESALDEIQRRGGDVVVSLGEPNR